MQKPYDEHITRLEEERVLLERELASGAGNQPALRAALASVTRQLRWYQARNSVRAA